MTTTEPTEITNVEQAEQTLPYTIFSISDQYYALSTEFVREMFTLPNTTPIPNSPDFCVDL